MSNDKLFRSSNTRYFDFRYQKWWFSAFMWLVDRLFLEICITMWSAIISNVPATEKHAITSCDNQRNQTMMFIYVSTSFNDGSFSWGNTECMFFFVLYVIVWHCLLTKYFLFWDAHSPKINFFLIFHCALKTKSKSDVWMNIYRLNMCECFWKQKCASGKDRKEYSMNVFWKQVWNSFSVLWKDKAFKCFNLAIQNWHCRMKQIHVKWYELQIWAMVFWKYDCM